MRHPIVLVAIVLSLAACTPAAGGQPSPSAATCPLTKPIPAFTPPSGYPPEPLSAGAAHWFGSASLWTTLSSDGEVWEYLPKAANGSVGQKTFWWRDGYWGDKEPQPAITVSGKRLDGAGTFTAGNPGTNASFDGTSSMLVGIDIPSAGCWQLTGSYRGAELQYVVLVKAD